MCDVPDMRERVLQRNPPSLLNGHVKPNGATGDLLLNRALLLSFTYLLHLYIGI